jgi:hypothetical protein
MFNGIDSTLTFQVDVPLYREQVDLLEGEFKELSKGRNDKKLRLFFEFFLYISQDSHGSFVFHFRDSVLELSDEEQDGIAETLNVLMDSTDWFGNWATFNSIQNDVDSFTKEELLEGKLLEEYLDSSINCGYLASSKNLQEVFDGKLTKSEIDSASLLHKIKNPDKWTD